MRQLGPPSATSFHVSSGYELSRRAGVLGTPERPLSDLGLRSYVTFWISVLVRFFRLALSILAATVSPGRFSGAFLR